MTGCLQSVLILRMKSLFALLLPCLLMVGCVSKTPPPKAPPLAQIPGVTAPEEATGLRVRMKTNRGDIIVHLQDERAPGTVENFMKYVEAGFYDGTVFHRVIPGFMIQGGGFTPTGGLLQEKETRAPIKNEARNALKNRRATIAMARRGDPHSATSQFFINLVENDNLDYPNPDGHGYAVFGKVIEGMDVVDDIATSPTATRGYMKNVPVKDVVIKSIRKVE